MRYYPNNTLTHFTTRLQNAISLSGDWEVALFEIQYPHTWFNLEKSEARVIYTQSGDVVNRPSNLEQVLRPPSGYYESAYDLVETINDLIAEFARKQQLPSFTRLQYNPITKRTTGVVDRGVSLQFSPTICEMLGIGYRQNPIANEEEALLRWKANHAADVKRGFSSLFVYCNLLEHIPVGDTTAPLLRIVNVTGKNGDNVHEVYEKPLYVPLQQKNFDSIELDIRNDVGDSIPFESGKLVALLHFRLRKQPYLLQ
jgi:hypothetical protein